MKDKDNHIIYVGKSKNLKNRVTSYFRGCNSHTTKVQAVVVNITEVEYIITDTETESIGEILLSFVVQHYSGTSSIPKEVILSDTPNDQELLADWLNQKADYKVKTIEGANDYGYMMEIL